jgi:hypothetical protein
MQIENAVHSFYPPLKWSVFHRIKFTHRDPFTQGVSKDEIVDSIHAQPARRDKRGKAVPGRFDTALIRDNDDTEGSHARDSSVVGRIRCVFTIPPAYLDKWFTPETRPKAGSHFAYIDWFTPFPKEPRRHHGLYRISPLHRNNEQQSSIVPVDDIWHSIHLFPVFGPIANREWKSSTVLDQASQFYVNPFSSRFMYTSLY